MRVVMSRVIVVATVGCFTLGAVPAYKREKKSTAATFQTLAAANYLACPELFGEAALASYLRDESQRRYSEYRHAAEFDPAGRNVILAQTREEIRLNALGAYRTDGVYTLKDVEFQAGTYDLPLGAIGFRVAKSVTVALPGSGRPPGTWSALRRAAELGPYSVTVYPEYPREAPFMWQEARGLVFVAVEKSAAEEFAASYPAGNRVNLDNDGRRKARAYLDIKITGCADPDPRFTWQRGLAAQVVGLRIYAMSSYDRSAQGLLFEWPSRVE